MIERPEIEQWLRERLAEALELEPEELDAQRPFSFYGLQSSTVIPIAGELETYLGRRLSPTLLFEYPSIASLANHLSAENVSSASPVADQGPAQETDGDDSRAIAIIGMSCRLPGANSLSEYWSLLASGSSAVTTVPADRWDIEAFYDADPSVPGKSISKWGGFLRNAAGFDAAFFGVSPREALRMDPQQRHALEVAWEALENAGQTPASVSGSNTGVFFGISHVEYSHVQFRDPDQIDGYAAAGNSLSIAANRLSYAFDLHGPSLALDTACSSSLVAVHLACASLRRGECAMALAGGANFNLLPEISIALSKAGILAPDGRCKPFDQRADGYVRGEGVGVIVLKPLAAALRDGDPIHAVIRGSAVTHDGKSNGIMAPNQRAQEQVIAAACRDAGIAPSQIDYVEAHGTGTFLGDAIEAKALGAVVGANRGDAGPCRIGSVKSNIGHLEPAAGIASLIKVVLALRHAQLPASLHCETKSSEIPFEKLGLEVQTELQPWPVGQRTRRAGVSAFGFGGANAHVVLEEHRPALPSVRGVTDTVEVSLLSARSRDSLKTLARELAGYARETTRPGQVTASLTDIAGTLATRRLHHHERLAVVSRSREELSAQLEAFAAGKRAAHVHTGSRQPGRRPAVCFVFSGQGGQWAYAGRALARRHPVFHDMLGACDSAFRRAGWPSLLLDMEGADASQLENTEVAQPLIFACQVSLAALFASWGLVPRCVIGHSVGEVAAACVAGALDLEAAAAVVTQRGRLMQPLKGGGQMLAVRAPERELRAALADYPGQLGLAALNGPRSWVVSGEPAPLQELRARLEAQGFSTHLLRSAYAFHSPQTARLAPALEQALRGLAPRSGQIDYLSSVSGSLVDGATLDAGYWARNAAECVSFWPAVECAKARGVDVFLELGPHPLLLNDIQASASREAPIVAIGTLRREAAELEAIADTVGALYSNGVDLDWASVFDAGSCAALPSCPWQHQDYWLNTGTEDTPSTAPRRLGKRWVAGEHVELVSQPGAHVFNGVLDKRLKSLLRGRQRSGRTLLTEALQLEALLQGSHGAGVEKFALVELQLEPEAELGSSPQPMQTSLLPQWPGRWNIALHTRRAGRGPAEWQRQIGGVLLASEAGSPLAMPQLDPAALDFAPPDDWLSRLAKLGLELGKAVVLGGVASCGNDTVLRLALPESARAEASDFVIHPALLDVCFQCASLLPDVDARLRRVARIERAQVGGPLGASAFARLRRARSAGSSDSLRVEIHLFDSLGNGLVELSGVELVAVGDAPAVAISEDLQKDVWLYDLAWQPRPLAQAAPLPSNSGCWLILADHGGTGLLLANELTARGERCLEVRAIDDGSEPRPDAPALYVDPDAEGAFARLLCDVAARGFTNLRGIVHCWAASLPPFSETSLDELQRAERLGCRSLLRLVQALQRASLPQPPRLWIVTRGARAVQPADEANLAVAQAPIWGFARGVDLELPEYECSLIDLDPHATSLSAESAVDEMLSDEGERQVAFRGDERLVARLLPVELPAPRAQSPVRADGTYLITGGLGGIGLEVAFWMARQGARSLALLGRSAPAPEISARLRELEQAGVRVKVLSADVTDPAALADVLAEARRESPLKGIVHAAGVVDDGALLDLDAARLATVLAPKVQGAWNLDRLTRDDPLDFFVLFSSVASLLGNPGQTNYNAANCFLDSLSYVRRGRGRPALAINWGPWAEVGMLMRAGDRLKKAPAHLVKLIAPSKGLLLLERLMGKAAAQVAVMPWDIPTLRRYYPAGPGQRLFAEHVSGSEAGSEEARQRPSERPLLRQDYVAPRNETETLIAQIWQTTLNLDQVGVCDNFFELGGDSVLGGQIISKINRAFSVSVNVRESFAVFTVAELASAVQRLLAERLSSLSDAEVEMLLQEGGAEAVGSG